MFVIRAVTAEDFDAVHRLAAVLNTVNLPDDADALGRVIKKAVRSFEGRVRNSADREFLFVMEDTTTGAGIGTSQIIAQHGTREHPHIFFRVLKEERYSRTVDRLFKHTVLRIGFDYDGPSEIGGLVLDPAYRKVPGKLGKQLSFIRFMFMAAHRETFRPRVLAELLPPFLEGGRSALWEALGRRFTELDYREADLISKDNKEFIKGLFPTGAIYVSLLDKNAQEVVGQVGDATRGVQHMLESIGFRYVDRVDPFDGGPHFEANLDELWPVQQTEAGRAHVTTLRAIRDAPGQSAEGLVSASKKGTKHGRDFRAVWSHFRRTEKDDVIEIPDDVAEVLRVGDKSPIHVLPFAWHTRM
jgi:arginine N-succinyltransferase